MLLPGWRSDWSRKVLLEYALLRAEPGDRLDIQLGSSLFLTKEIKVPIAARANLAKVVSMAVRQSSPGGGRNLIWRHQVKGRSGKELLVQVFILKNTVLPQLTSQAEAAGASIRMVSIADALNAQPLLDNRKEVDRPLRLWSAATAALLTAALLGVSWIELRETRTLQLRKQELVTEQRQLAEHALRLRERLDQQNAGFTRISNDIQTFEDDHRRLALLLDLTDALSDTTWVSEASLFQRRVQLSGFTSDDVPSLLSSLRNLPWATKAELDGPVSFDSFNRKSRFEFIIHTQSAPGTDG
ncbi:hypothetical protein RA26_20010 [Leisingera sp. ANG-M7]|nr:hypothetical protein RA26_20010 [Leisingera sp. ANG-M7]